ncbi:helix-turn-helix domain-containing protein [Pseudofrankia sp. DC12]|uniref:helix-turn-helix domain-containing protein n=1 Tax=Pseudofrankia sp. DC12 TaxID=683315 RepID=UPI0005F7CB97|nr:helix-turn-helix domain-containing protein [Pseudofrankia sp. DC12]
MTPSEPTRAVYVRMPDKLAQKLDKAAERFGVSKRDLLATLVSDHLDIEGDEIVFRPHGRDGASQSHGKREGASRPPRPGDLWRKRPSADEPDADDAEPKVRMSKATGPEPPAPAAPVSEVLTLEEAAELLRVPVDDVRALVESGELPARHIGATWRLTRTAVLAWLAGPGPAPTA